jgi:hypothetical protein
MPPGPTLRAGSLLISFQEDTRVKSRFLFSRLIPAVAIIGLVLTLALSGPLSQSVSAGKNGAPNKDNSANAKLCQKGGWQNLQTSDGHTFANQSECVSAGAQGATLQTIPPPTDIPTQAPTDIPTLAPTDIPTQAPTEPPTVAPTDTPTQAPTDTPTEVPTDTPTLAPTDTPTEVPTETPTETPTVAPTATASPAPAPVVQVLFGVDPIRPGQCKVGATLSNFAPSTTYDVWVTRGGVWYEPITMQTDSSGAASSPPYSAATYGATSVIQLVVLTTDNKTVATSAPTTLYSNSC